MFWISHQNQANFGQRQLCVALGSCTCTNTHPSAGPCSQLLQPPWHPPYTPAWEVGTQLSGCSMTSPGSAREETVSLKHLHQQELESRYRQAGGNCDPELVGLVVGAAETIAEHGGRDWDKKTRTKELVYVWRLSLARCAEKE